jgi:hypothetical protein
LSGFSKEEIDEFTLQDFRAIEKAQAELMYLNNSQQMLIQKYALLLKSEDGKGLDRLIKQLTNVDIRPKPKLTRAEYESYDIDIEKTGLSIT